MIRWAETQVILALAPGPITVYHSQETEVLFQKIGIGRDHPRGGVPWAKVEAKPNMRSAMARIFGVYIGASGYAYLVRQLSQ